MENINEEKSLVKVDNGIFARMRRFFRNIFSRRKESYYSEEISNENVEKESQYKVDEYAQPKLFNYDDPKNYIGKENDISTESISNASEFDNSSETIQNQEINYNNTTLNNNISHASDTNQEAVQEAENNETKYIGISKYFEDVDENYIGKSKRQVSEKREDGYEGKEELEQKLMNYYASIKKVIQ